jgi:hypothetical protein
MNKNKRGKNDGTNICIGQLDIGFMISEVSS